MKVAGKLHGLDAVELAVQPRVVVGMVFLQQPAAAEVATAVSRRLLQAFAADLFEVGVEGLAFGDEEVREGVLDLGHLEVAAVDELHGAGADLVVAGEGLVHLVRGLDVELLRVELEALGIVHRAGGLDAEQDLVGAAVVVADVVRVVGGDERDVEFALHLEELVADLLVGFEAVILDFEEEVVLAEHLGELAGGALGLVVLPCHEVLVELAGEAAGEADEAFGVAGEEVFGDAGLAVEAVEGGLGGEAHEVAIAGFIFGEHEEVVVAVSEGAVVVGFGEVELAAEDGLDAFFLHGVEEVDGAEDVAVVGHGGGGLTDF